MWNSSYHSNRNDWDRDCNDWGNHGHGHGYGQRWDNDDCYYPRHEECHRWEDNNDYNCHRHENYDHNYGHGHEYSHWH